MRGDLATWCRILAVGPPCGVACEGCRARPITMSTIRDLTPEEPMTEPIPVDVDTGDKAHLITFGFTARQRVLTEGLDATHVDVDLTSDVEVWSYVLAVVDAAELAPTNLVAVGPYAFGWACAGRLPDLRDWVGMRAPAVRLVVVPDPEESETYVQSAEVYKRLGAVAGLDIGHPDGMGWLLAETQR